MSRLTRNRPLWRKELQQDPNLSTKDTRECCIWFPFQKYTVSVQCSLAQMQWKIQMTFKTLIKSHQLPCLEYLKLRYNHFCGRQGTSNHPPLVLVGTFPPSENVSDVFWIILSFYKQTKILCLYFGNTLPVMCVSTRKEGRRHWRKRVVCLRSLEFQLFACCIIYCEPT